MKLGVEVKNGQQSSNPELCFWSDPRNHPNHPTHYPPNLPQNTNFANIGPISMKLGVVVKNEQQSSNPELFFWSDFPNHPNHPTPYPPNPPQNTNIANIGLIWMKLGLKQIRLLNIFKSRFLSYLLSQC